MANNDFKYDVFLSFRGEGGTRHGFTDHLFRALLRRGINVFRDDQKLSIGDELRPSLLHAIEASRISMVVLCQNYASSTWCLDELAKIIDCYENKGKRKPVSAIFYKVEPSDVRHQRNSYKDAMIQHENRFGKESEKVKRWRYALSRVCDLIGGHCTNDTYESELIEKIVKDNLAKLPPMPLQIKHLVGLDSRFEQMKSLIDIDSNDDVCMLGIYGVLGIGKTTFAVDLYNKIVHHFEAACLLENVREKSNKSVNGLEDLQSILLSEMGEKMQTLMGSTFKRSSEIKRRLCRKRVLLVLDDVDTVEQLESLAGGCDWFGPGSRIIITTRDIDVLRKHDVEIKKYKMEELNCHESLELFSWHAFNMSRPVENFANISSRAVSYANGIPLALRVIGSNLKGENVEEWEIILQKYKKVPDAKIQDVLEISYKSLSELDKKIFLDIACFFKGERWDYVKSILDACDFGPYIRVFVSKCLITVDENGCLEMHDLIQDMGREIVRKESPSNPGDRSRLWSHKEVLEVLEENSGSTTIEGIMLHPSKQEKVDHWIYTAFEKMKNLRILIVRNTIFLSGPTNLPNSLRLLDWKGYPAKSFPSNFYPRRIVDFKLPYSSLILKEPFQKYEVLTLINLSQCQSITQIPDLSRAENLRVLALDKCRQLIRFDKSIGFMPNLVYLSASGCTELKSFVPKMYLPSLEVLSFNFCTKFEHFPQVMQKMDKPLKIHMINTAIKEFPKSIGNLTGLEYIDLSICKGLKDLSSNFLLLPKLVTLKIDGCFQLGESFRRFKESHSLAYGCPNLVTLYTSEANLSCEDLNVILEMFTTLEDLKVSHNGFVALPKCIKESLHLKSLDVSFCRNLRKIPELPLSIEKVDARHCQSLTSEASSRLWSKVSKEIPRIQVVMPMLKMETPEWFDWVCTQEIPLFWARRKFPIVALALVFQVKEMDTSSEIDDAIKLLTGLVGWYTVSLHLFIDSQEICARDYHYFNVGEDHVLLCDLRVLFSYKEWQALDASLGDDWKTIQVQYDSDMILSKWGVYVYKQETNMNDIQFRHPNSNSSKDYMPSSRLVPKVSLEQQIRHMLENFNPRDMFNGFLILLESEEGRTTRDMLKEFLTLLESEEDRAIFIVILRFLRDAKGEIRAETSASVYGASLNQEHEESDDDVVRVLEMIKENIPKHFADSCPEDIQSVSRLMERFLRARGELMKESRWDIDMYIVLEYTDIGGATIQRFWGMLELKAEDPFYEAVLRKANQLLWEFDTSNEASSSDHRPRLSIVLLKCQGTATDETSSSGHEESSVEGYYNPELEELMRRIEHDAMRWNKSYGKIKASIVRIHDPISDEYVLESIYKRRVIKSTKSKWLQSLTEFKITPYGRVKAEDDPLRHLKMCIWVLLFVLMIPFACLPYFMVSVLNILFKCLFFFVVFVGGFFGLGYLSMKHGVLPIIGKLLEWGRWFVEQILVSCKYLHQRIDKITRKKEKEKEW